MINDPAAAASRKKFAEDRLADVSSIKDKRRLHLVGVALAADKLQYLRAHALSPVLLNYHLGIHLNISPMATAAMHFSTISTAIQTIERGNQRRR